MTPSEPAPVNLLVEDYSAVNIVSRSVMTIVSVLTLHYKPIYAEWVLPQILGVSRVCLQLVERMVQN